MNKPEKLVKGNIVALVNPAGMMPERFAKQLEFVREYLLFLGYQIADYVVYENWENPDARASALHDAFCDEDVKAIFPICGGKLVYDLLTKLDYEAIRGHPKIFVGSSELSSLALCLSQFSNFITFFGPHLNFINPRASYRETLYSVRSFWNMLTWDWHGSNGLDIHEAYNFFRAPKKKDEPIVIKNIYAQPEKIKVPKKRDNVFLSISDNAEISGKLLIASLGSLLSVFDTGIAIELKDKILIVDSLDSSFGQVLNMVLKLCRITDLSKISGLCFSSLAERSDRKEKILPELTDKNSIKIFIERTNVLFNGKIPILFGLPLGHCYYKLTLPIDIPAVIDTHTGYITLSETPFKQKRL